MIPKRRIGLSYAAVVATPWPTPVLIDNTFTPSQSNVDMIYTSLPIPTPKYGNRIILADLETSRVSIQSERDSMQSGHKQLCKKIRKFFSRNKIFQRDLSTDVLTCEWGCGSGIGLTHPFVNTSGKAGAQIPQLPLGDNSSPWGDNAICV
jgi:hypothetical protein